MIKKIQKRAALMSLLLALSSSAFALTFALPTNGDNVVGDVYQATSLNDETLGEVGRRFDVGYYEMVEANPRINPDRTLRTGTKVIIPARYILPDAPRDGIVINLAELRLYYYPAGTGEVVTAPVGIGRVGWGTPLGTTQIIEKVKDPIWHPTDAVREDAARQGVVLPKAWPAGPDNPLGAYMMRMAWRTYLVHGTDRPDGVGKRSSAGCIRMFPEDIQQLFSLTALGTTVHVVNSPIKVGWDHGTLLLEAHSPLQEKGQYVTDDSINMVSNITRVASRLPHTIVKWAQAKAEVERQSGIPVEIGNVSAASEVEAPEHAS